MVKYFGYVFSVSHILVENILIFYICRYDAVTYLKYLDSLRAAENFRSVWIFAESSYKIFEYAKKRVYHFGRLDGGKLIGKSKSATTKKRKLEDSTTEKEGVVLDVMYCLTLSSSFWVLYCHWSKLFYIYIAIHGLKLYRSGLFSIFICILSFKVALKK